MKIDTNRMLPIVKIPKKFKDHKSISAFAEEAKEFLMSKTWCKNIITGYVGMQYEGILAVFYFEIEPISEEIDSSLWVITGDIPPAYLVTDRTPNPACALAVYVEEMNLWVDAVKNNKPLDDIIPVNVPPDMKYAKMLENRLTFIKERILIDYKDELEIFYR
jgi:hypothetical protein